MTPFGFTRSRVEREYALICPDSFVRAPRDGNGRSNAQFRPAADASESADAVVL